MYRKYLSQFCSDESNVIPHNVLKVLYQNFFSIHMLNSLKCRPTSVTNVLLSHNLNMYVHQSVRICRKFNNEPIPKFSEALIDILVQRFQDVSKVAPTIENFGKLPALDILTHLFLRAEKRDDLATIFFLNKVLDSAAEKLQKLVDRCADIQTNNQTNNQTNTSMIKLARNWVGIARIC